jgi:outer membrane protein OmpA-like peptidoglycan-associated protein
MKTLLLVLSAGLFCSPLRISAQNLVPDPGFENLRKMPTKKNNSIACTKNWFCPMNGAGDYYHHDAERHAGTPRNVFGKQEPHSGEAYAGICIRKKFIEYIETKLTDTLQKDRDYLVEFYISRANRSIGAVKEFGVLFLKKISMGMPGVGIVAEPAVETVLPKGFRNKRSWIKFSAIYHAEGDETALILGYFKNKKTKAFKGYAHYYIDDVSVHLIENKTEIPAAIPIAIGEKTEDPAPAAFSPKPGETVRLQNIFFATNKSELLPGSFEELDKLAKYLLETPGTSISISGHTDNTGNEDRNRSLSEARAKAVADYLVSKGFYAAFIKYEGYGSAQPIAPNDTEEGRQQNRRVEFVISKE